MKQKYERLHGVMTAVQWGERIQDAPLYFMRSKFSEGASATD